MQKGAGLNLLMGGRWAGNQRAVTARDIGATAHPGSKPGYQHRHVPTRQEQRDLWYGHLAANNALSMLPTGQSCVPPHVKQRKPLEPVKPLSSPERKLRYLGVGHRAQVRSEPTPAQSARLAGKAAHIHARRRTTPDPVTFEQVALRKTPPGTTQPASGQMPRAMRKRIGAMPKHQQAAAIAAWERRNDRSCGNTIVAECGPRSVRHGR